MTPELEHVAGAFPPAVTTLYTVCSPTEAYPGLATSCSQSTAPVPAGPVLAVDGAGISPVFLQNRILFASLKLNTGVPSAAKKWFPSTVKEEIGAGRSVRGELTAMGGRLLKESSFAVASAVPSKRVAIAPRATGTEDALAQV